MANINFHLSRTSIRIIIIFFFIIIIDIICAILFIPNDSSYNDFRVMHSYYHHTLYPNQCCITNINVQNKRYANMILGVPSINRQAYILKTNTSMKD